MELFEGDTDKVKALDKKICEKLGYDKYFAVSGQPILVNMIHKYYKS